MNLDSIALWLGYGAMIVGGGLSVMIMLLAVGLVLAGLTKVLVKHLRLMWDLNTLRKTMRQLEAEGKVRELAKRAFRHD